MEETARDNSYLGTEAVKPLMKRLAIPAVAAQIVNLLYNIVDRVYIGHMPVTGSAALTGLGVCAPIIFVISAFAALVFFGSSARASISMGAGDYDGAEKIMGGCFTLLIAVALAVTAAVEIFARPLLFLFGASDATIGYAVSYIRWYAAGTVFVSLTLGLNAFITAQGFAGVSMRTVMIGAVCNIVLDPIFIFAFHMGVAGAAIATVISQGVSAAWVLSFLTGKKTVLKLRPKNFPVRWKLMLPGIALGLSPFIMQATEGLLNICFNSSLQRYGGDIAVGAMTIISTVGSCMWMILMGFSQGAQPIISFSYGAGKPERVREAFSLLLRTCFIFSTLVWLAMMLVPHVLCAALTDNAELVSYAAWAMRIYAASMLLLGVQCACQQTFIGIGNAKTSLFLAVLRKLILLIPLIYVMPLFISDKVMAVYLAEPVADFISVATTALMFHHQFGTALKKLKENTSEA
jgi:putative MATE family efflux protein